MRESVRRRYDALAQSGELVPDPLQAELADLLDGLAEALRRRSRANGRNPIARLLSRRAGAQSPRGLYIWGGVGRGKTLLMDLFFAAAPLSRKRRVHFHQFMGEVHDRAAWARKEPQPGKIGRADPIAAVARGIAAEIDLLCFDEFAVHDIADAMILGRLFEQLFRHGVTIVATSNVEPDRLYEGGLNRALFLPFMALLKERMNVFHLDAPRDYRLDASGTERRYVTPLGPEADACLAAHLRHFARSEPARPAEIAVKGRRIPVLLAANGVAQFSFAELCSRPLGAADYLKIAETFPIVILSDVPVLAPERRNEARRFINLIDTFYDRGVRLIVSAEAEPEALWHGKDGTETFEFRRTASRLVEMRSDAYWNAAGERAVEKKEAQAVMPGPCE